MAIPSDESRDPGLNLGRPSVDSSRVNRWLLLATLGLVLTVGAGLGYVIHERENTARLALANSELTGQLTAMRSQMTSLQANLKALTAPVPPEPAPPAPQPWSGEREQQSRIMPRRAAIRDDPAQESKSQRQMKQELLQQENRLTVTQQDLARTRAALDTAISSTHGSLSDLGGSIARNHAELAALERLGMRGYYEFDLSKSKRFKRAGPISISLRHTNTKHKNYSVVLLVDDYQLSKKNVDLYEPISLETEQNSQPVELVVNRIGKNTVHGYVSVAKPMMEKTSAGLGGVSKAGTGAAASSPERSQAGQVALTRRAHPQL